MYALPIQKREICVKILPPSVNSVKVTIISKIPMNNIQTVKQPVQQNFTWIVKLIIILANLVMIHVIDAMVQMLMIVQNVKMVKYYLLIEMLVLIIAMVMQVLTLIMTLRDVSNAMNYVLLVSEIEAPNVLAVCLRINLLI